MLFKPALMLFLFWHPSGPFIILFDVSTLALVPLIHLVHFSVRNLQLAILYILADGCLRCNHLTSFHVFFIALPISRLAFLGFAFWDHSRGSWGVVHLVCLFFLGAPGDFHV